MDAQGRRHAGDIDPADQWVFNPDTASYELRATPAAGDTRNPYGDRTTAPHQRTRPPQEHTHGHHEGTEGHVPPQRGRRDARPDRRRGTPQESREAPRAAGRGRRRPRPKKSAKKRVLQWVGGTLGILLIAGCAGGAFLYYRLDGFITAVDTGEDNPAVTDGPLNMLLIGTDSRQGEGNKGYGDTGSVGHADTTLLFHISEDRSNATVLSIPRDLIVDIPDCKVTKPDGSTKIVPGSQDVRFNQSLGQNGRTAACTYKTVEKVLGVDLHHFMLADFNAVKTLSTAVGGVEVCLEHDIDDPKSHLQLSAGRHVIEGEQALAFVRTRHSVGFESDLDRIRLQQQFLGSMVRKMKSTETLTDPGKLYDLAKAATKALTVDTGIGSISKLTALAKDLRRVDTENITFLTLPVIDNPENTATLLKHPTKAEPVLRMIRQDKSLTETEKEKKKKDKGPNLDKVEKAPAAEVRVDVLNGGAPTGSAQTTLTWLQTQQGVPLSTNAGNASKEVSRTTLEFAPNQASQAATLAEMMGLADAALKQTSTDAGPQEPMTLTLGPDFKEAGTPIEAPDKAPEDVRQINASDKSVCAG